MSLRESVDNGPVAADGECHAIQSERGAVTRRSLLCKGGTVLGVLVAGGPALAACGSSSGNNAVGHAGSGAATHADAVNFFSYQGYDLLDEKAMKAWRQQHHVTISSTYAASTDEITAKFTGGGRGLYNLSTYNAGYGPFYRSLGITTPLNLAKIPNFNDLYAIFRSGPVASRWWNLSGHQWGIGWTWGIQGINYNAAKVKAPASYKDLTKPIYKGRLGITDDVAANITLGARAVGIFRVSSLYTKPELARIIAFWQQLKPNARAIASGYGDLASQFVAGEIVVGVPGWAAVNSFAAQKGLDTVKHTIPAEGGLTFCDSWFIPAGAKNTDVAYEYINEALSPEVQAQAATELVQGVVNPKALPFMDAATRALYPYQEIDRVFLNAAPLSARPVKAPPGYANFADWNHAWESFKAS